MQVPVYDLNGTKIKDLKLNKAIFEAKINEPLMAQAMRVFLSNQREAGAKTKTRGEIDYSSKKLFRQKGTGNARHGSRKAGTYVGGFKAHGPRGDQNYTLTLSKKMKIAALKSMLSQKAAEKQIAVIEGLSTIKKPKTKDMAGLMTKIMGEAKKVALVLNNKMETANLATRNLAKVNICMAENLNIHEVCKKGLLIFATESLDLLEARLIKTVKE